MLGLIDTSISRLLARIKGANDSIDTISLTVHFSLPIPKRFTYNKE